mmetsp:Transcript_14988/g.23923  ORF Transcript_14988/g.23923 Transcript_14988/m.23923 type:complete len:541 (-) Transcript_14988:196-1818(-)
MNVVFREIGALYHWLTEGGQRLEQRFMEHIIEGSKHLSDRNIDGNSSNQTISSIFGGPTCANATEAVVKGKKCGEISEFLDLSFFYLTERWAAMAALVFATIAIILSLHQISLHFRYNKHRDIRNYTYRILFMVPVFAAESFLALCFIEMAPVMRMLREFYEAFALFSFTSYILTYLGGPGQLAYSLHEEKTSQPHVFPFCCLKKWPKGGKFLWYTLMGILQYIPVSICVTTAGLVCWYNGVYGDGRFDFTKAYLYCTLVQNFSQIWALYCLVLLYRAVKGRLYVINPLRKFLCIKLIVFFTWWQAVTLAALTKVRAIQKLDNEIKVHWNSHALADPIGEGLTNLIICVEMVFFALAHRYAYPYTEFNDESYREIRGGFFDDDSEGPMDHFIEGMNFLDFASKFEEFNTIDTERKNYFYRDGEDNSNDQTVNCWDGGQSAATEETSLLKHNLKYNQGPAYGLRRPHHHAYAGGRSSNEMVPMGIAARRYSGSGNYHRRDSRGGGGGGSSASDYTRSRSNSRGSGGPRRRQYYQRGAPPTD